jgi:N-acetylglucosamine-6-sulfatase
MLVFMSDNGILLGEHHWFGKKVPYEESIRVPMIVRYDPVTGGTASTDPHLVLNVDLAPTFAGAADVSAPGVEGKSLLPLLDGSATSWRSDFLIEHRDPTNHVEVPTYCGVRTEHDVYVEYSTGEEELYDLDADPYELQNLAGDASEAALQASLHQRMLELCSPPPPGFTP